MSRFTHLLIFSILIPCIVTIPPQSPQPKDEQPQNEPQAKSNLDEKGAVVVNVKPKTDTASLVDTSHISTVKNNSNSNSTDPKDKLPNNNVNTKTNTNTLQNDSHIEGNEVDSDTLKRGILVLVALSMLFIFYLGYRTYRNRSKAPNPMVRKYGVRTRRGDIEMTPLPLSDDEDDETVFELDRRPSQV